MEIKSMSNAHVEKMRVKIPNSSSLFPNDISIRLTERTYLPPGESERGWMPLTVQTLKVLARHYAPKRVAFVGCGPAVEAIYAANAFRPQTMYITDVHEEVVEAAKENLRSNIPSDLPLRIEARCGSLCEPLQGEGPFDLIYENLPNVWSSGGIGDLDQGVLRASFFAESELADVPTQVAEAGLTLHYKFLRQAKLLLAPGGSALCCIGSRINPATIVEILSELGMPGRVISYGPVAQFEADRVLPKYSDLEVNYKRPFKFFRYNQLAREMNICAIATQDYDDDLLPLVRTFWEKTKHGITAAAAKFESKSEDGLPGIGHIGTCFEFRAPPA